METPNEKGRAGCEAAGAPEVGHGIGTDELSAHLHDAPRRIAVAPSFDPQEATELEPLGAGYELIPLHAPDALGKRGQMLGKAPIGSGWRVAAALTFEEAREHMASGRNVGVRLRDTDLVVDVDPRNFADGDDPLERLQADLGVDLTAFPTVITGSGGKHIYMTKPPEVLLRDTLDAYQGVEFKACGRQVVAPGSVHPVTGKAYRWDDDELAVPLSMVAAAPAKLIAMATRPEHSEAVQSGERTPEALAVWLEALDVLDFRDQAKWLELMMASHHATGGDGRSEWIAWSTGDPAYDGRDGEIGRRWDSLHADHGTRRITEKTLFKALVEAGRKDLLPDDREGVVAGVASEWVWVADAEQFVRRGDSKKYSALQWKSLYAHLLPDADIVTAVQRGKFPMRKFESIVYVPGAKEFPNGADGVQYNLWRPSGVEARAGDVSPFLKHMEYLFPNEIERGHVLDFMALLIQRPAEKLHFALLIRGRQGTGKSWIGQLLERLIGTRNVVRPSNDEVTSRWTSWMEGAQLGIVEELMTVGRFDVANRLKTVITEPTLRIEEKKQKIYSIPNHLNLVCFTNHEDALPVEHGDRRWLVVFSPAEPREEDYYSCIFRYLEGGGPSAVKHWLEERNVKLNPKGVAPATRGKAEMRRLSLSEVESYLLELLEERQAPFDFDLVRFEDIVGAIPGDMARKVRNLRNLATRFLKTEAGARQHTRYTKGDRQAYQLWSVRNHDLWTAAGAAGRIDAFMKHQAM